VSQENKNIQARQNVKLPPFNGKETCVAKRRGWSEDDCLDELLPRLEGPARLVTLCLNNYQQLLQKISDDLLKN
jgi:hypothetical protein